MGMVWVMTRADDDEAAALRADPSAVYDFVNSEEAHASGRTLDLDKEWHAVHFMLTGSAGSTDSPLSLILGRFEEVGPDNGYGPAWFVPKTAIAACHHALLGSTDDELVRRYDASAAVREQVYLADTLEEEGDEALEFLAADLARFRAFVNEAATAGDNAFALIT